MSLTKNDISLISGLLSFQIYNSLEECISGLDKYFSYYGLEIKSYENITTSNIADTQDVYVTSFISFVPSPGSLAQPLIIINSRGSDNLDNWANNFNIYQSKAVFPFTDPSLPLESAKTFKKWNEFSLYDWNPTDETGTVCDQTGIKDLIECELQNPIFNNCNIVFSGHSAGNLIVSFHAAACAQEFNNPVNLITFASPKVGNDDYAKVIRESIEKSGGNTGWIRRYNVPTDIVPLLSIFDLKHVIEEQIEINIQTPNQIQIDFEDDTLGGISDLLTIISNYTITDPEYVLGLQESKCKIKPSSFIFYLLSHEKEVYKESLLREYWYEGGELNDEDIKKFMIKNKKNKSIKSFNNIISVVSKNIQKDLNAVCDYFENPEDNTLLTDLQESLKKIVNETKKCIKNGIEKKEEFCDIIKDVVLDTNSEIINLTPIFDILPIYKKLRCECNPFKCNKKD